MLNNLFRLLIVVAIVGWIGRSPSRAAGGGTMQPAPGAIESNHFDPKGKLPSRFTTELQNGLRKTLPFEDKRDFEEAKRGFIAAPPYKRIMADAGNVAWDMGSQ